MEAAPLANLADFRPSWHSSAACAGQLDVMFGQFTYRAAREVCAGCDYVTECRADADRPRPGSRVYLFGIVAGENPAERVERRAVEALEAVPVAVSA